jgi:hypothetical protein
VNMDRTLTPASSRFSPLIFSYPNKGFGPIVTHPVRMLSAEKSSVWRISKRGHGSERSHMFIGRASQSANGGIGYLGWKSVRMRTSLVSARNPASSSAMLPPLPWLGTTARVLDHASDRCISRANVPSRSRH